MIICRGHTCPLVRFLVLVPRELSRTTGDGWFFLHRDAARPCGGNARRLFFFRTKIINSFITRNSEGTCVLRWSFEYGVAGVQYGVAQVCSFDRRVILIPDDARRGGGGGFASSTTSERSRAKWIFFPSRVRQTKTFKTYFSAIGA